MIALSLTSEMNRDGVLKMKKSFVFVLLVASIFLTSCSVKESQWAIEEEQYNGLYGYKITQTPDSFKEFTGTYVYYKASNRNATNGWTVSHKNEIENYLKKNDLQIIPSRFGDNYLFLPHGFFVTKINQNELSYIWDVLSTQYAGFAEMQDKGFTKKKLMAVKDSRDFDKLFDEYIDDCHFSVRIRDYYFDKPTARDEGTFASRDPDGFYFEKETENAYYIRFTNCISEDYHTKFQSAVLDASKKDFIILDARSNKGGDNAPLGAFKEYLNIVDYKGTVICLQDNWSYSSGELWHAFGTKDVKFKSVLVGTHSGGMQRFDGGEYSNNELDVFIYAGNHPRDGIIPDNWLGEGKGYEPQIWATTENMKETLENLGVILDGVEFR